MEKEERKYGAKHQTRSSGIAASKLASSREKEKKEKRRDHREVDLAMKSTENYVRGSANTVAPSDAPENYICSKITS